MTCLYRNILISFSILLLLSLSSCGWKRGIQEKSNLNGAQQNLTSGEFQRALDTYHLAYQNHPKDPEILKSYIQAVEYIKTSGDGAFDRKDYVQSQMTYDLLLKNYPRFIDFANLLSFHRNLLITRLGMSRALGVENQASPLLKRGDFQKAIDLYKALYLQYPSDILLRDCCLRLLESIKCRADVAFKKNEFASAGGIYKILLKNYPFHPSLRRLLSYNSELLEARIENCQKILFENGLERYRSGNLDQAITLWKSILTFDSENPEVKKALDTAIFQSKNLKVNKTYDPK